MEESTDMIVESFEYKINEGEIYKNIRAEGENARIQISHQYAKDGQCSLMWKGKGLSHLHIRGDVGYRPFEGKGLDQNRDAFVFWVYLEKRRKETLLIHFMKNGKKCCSFPFYLNFTGWRTCWCPFSDMQGSPEIEMDEIIFEIESNDEFELYLDQIISSVAIDPRHPVRDLQIPFINMGADSAANAHWTSLYRFWKLFEDRIQECRVQKKGFSTEKVCSQDREDRQRKEEQSQIIERLDAYVMSHATFPTMGNLLVTDDECRELLEDCDVLLKHTVDSGYHKAAYPKEYKEQLSALTDSVDIKDYGQAMLQLAYAWRAGSDEQKPLLGDKYARMASHLLYQGWAAGSSLGTTHHMGYPMRPFYPSVFLMRDVLKEKGLLKDMAAMTAWYAGSGRIFRDSEELKGESIDTLNTLLQGILFSILLMEKDEERDVCLKGVKTWLSAALRPAPGLEGPFKEDGSAFHHCGHYPAYAMGGLVGAAPVVYALSNTRYALEKEAHLAMRKSLLTMRFYCNQVQWLISMSSRHPKGCGEMSQISNLEPFYYMALAGVPGEKSKVDEEMAGALLRLSEYHNFPKAQELAALGISKEEAPQGHISLNYACAGLHRRKEWLAGVRGHSRYLWGSEIYEKNNLFGRYITYGNLQILGSGVPVNQKDSGFFQEGWDWNCWPGTTAPVIDLERLRGKIRVVDPTAGMEEMLLSDESFAGGTQFENWHGMFGMKLHGHAKYDGSFRARKSWFFFDDRIVCLGSDIEDADEQAEVCTTLFQHYMGSRQEGHMWVEGKEKVVREEDITGERGMILMDPSDNVYIIPKGQKLRLTEGMQYSKSQNLGEDTCAPFAKAVLSHGSMPKKEEYEYIILVKGGKETVEKLEKEDAKGRMSGCEILQKDRRLHAVYDGKTGVTGSVFFESGTGTCWTGKSVISEAQNACLVMEKRIENELVLSVCDPDLRFYEGVEKDQIDEKGDQKEISLYSRVWSSNESKEGIVTLRLNGCWNLLDTEEEKVEILEEDGSTVLKIVCKDGKTVPVHLMRK